MMAGTNLYAEAWRRSDHIGKHNGICIVLSNSSEDGDVVLTADHLPSIHFRQSCRHLMQE